MLRFYITKLRKASRLIPFYLRQIFFLLKRGKFKGAYNYLWTMLITKEEGAGFADPFQLKSQFFVPYPGRIELEATTRCNFKCLKCESTYWDILQQDMSFENFKKIIDQFPKLKAISLSGIGHNWLNKDYMAMLEYVKSKSIYTQFFDTFYFIDEERARRLIDIQVNKIWMSLDGATKDTYEKQQVGSNFDRVIANVKNLVRLKKEMKSNFPEICFHFIVTKINFHEMPEFVRLIHSINSDPNQINLIQFTKLIPFKENLDLSPQVDEKILDETLQTAMKLKNFRISIYRMEKEEKKDICGCLDWTVPFITVDGNVYPCCGYTEGNMRKIMHKYAMGNVFKQDFKEIWYSKKFTEFRRMIHYNKVPIECKIRDCPAFKTN